MKYNAKEINHYIILYLERLIEDLKADELLVDEWEVYSHNNYISDNLKSVKLKGEEKEVSITLKERRCKYCESASNSF